MRNFTALFLCFVFVLWLDRVTPLKCRTGNQDTDDRFQKILKRCANRQSANARNNDKDSSSDEDSDDSDSDDSDEKMFDKKFQNGRSGSNARNASRNGGNSNNGNNGNNSQRSKQDWSSQPYPYNKRYNGTMNVRHSPTMNDRSSPNMQGGRPNGMNSDNNEMQSSDHSMACVIHCFFNDLNLVDPRGFPEKTAVIGIMTQGIRDQELRDFVEETVLDCFQSIDTAMNKEKCKFSQSLMTCMEDKGRQRCEDWDDTYANI